VSEFEPMLGPMKAAAAPVEPASDVSRKCPNCNVAESRWTVGGREYVNLSPLTGQCVDCLAAMSKEMGPPQEPSLFDARAAAANDRSDA
jgi:hypothetical protein